MTRPTLVVLAAGMGSRYGGLKQLDAVGPAGETIIDYSIFDALRSGFGRVVFVIRRDIANAFEQKIGRRYAAQVDVRYACQQLDALPAGYTVPEGRTKPWGTAHAILIARDQITGPFAVINGDDFYGRAGFEAAAGFLQRTDPDGCDYGMVGYRLAHTLSEHGSVSRGICTTDADGCLRQVVETHDIRRADDRILAADPHTPGQTIELTGDEVASMNLWGFSPSIFDHLDTGFRAFLDAHGDEPNSEIYIPSVVDGLIARGAARVRVLSCEARWFGVTFREDKPHVRASIARMVDAGDYPSPLWAEAGR